MSDVLLNSHGAATLRRYDATDVARIAQHLEAIHTSAVALPERLVDAPRMPGFVLVTAAVDARLVGFAVAAAHEGLVRIDPIAISNQLEPALAGDIATELTCAVLEATERPWADVSVAPDSPALTPLLRVGWQPTCAESGSGFIVLSGAPAMR